MDLLIISFLSTVFFINVQSGSFENGIETTRTKFEKNVVSIQIQNDPKCSGSFIGNHTVAVATRCIEGIPIGDIEVVFLNSTNRRIFYADLSTTLNFRGRSVGHKISLLMIKDMRDNIPEGMPLPQQNETIPTNGSLILLGWYKSRDTETPRMVFGSIELEIVDKSICLDKEREKNVKSDFQGNEICTRSAKNESLSYFMGGPVLHNGIQVAIASWYDEKSSIITCKGIADSRDKIVKEMDIYKSSFLNGNVA